MQTQFKLWASKPLVIFDMHEFTVLFVTLYFVYNWFLNLKAYFLDKSLPNFHKL